MGQLCARPTDGKGPCNSTVGGRDMTETQNEFPNERWLPVVGYEGIYDVSDYGRIRRMKAACGTSVGRLLHPMMDTHGYLQVCLSYKNSQHMLKVHRLVAQAFIGAYPPGKEINHRDGVKTNNALPNIEYVTTSENQLHALDLGLSLRGENHYRAKLCEADVHAIRSLFGEITQRSIAKKFGVKRTAISNIKSGKSWGWLPIRALKEE